MGTELKAKPTKPAQPVKPETPEKAAKPANLAKPSAKLSNKNDSDTQQDPNIPKTGKVNLMPFSVKLVRLTPDLINMYTTAKPAAREPPRVTPKVKQVNIKLHKLPLMPKQSVTVAPPQPKPSTSKVPT